MFQVSFFILIMLLCKMYLAQCPQNYKLSKLIPGQCIRNTICDGWVFLENVKVCLDKDPSVLPQYGKPSVNCKTEQGVQTQVSVFVCKNCPLQSPFGIDCTSCKSDEYSNFVQPSIGCIKKTDYSYQKYRGYLTVDKTSIIPECPSGQIFEESTTFGSSQNDLITLYKCKQCPIDAPLDNADKTKCIARCSTQDIQREVIDKRTTPNKCIFTKDCKGFISWDEWACKSKCESWEIIQDTFLSIPVCKKCPKDKPYVSVDRTQCVRNCGQGNVYGEKEKACIPLSACRGYMKDDNKEICFENSCQQNLSGITPAYYTKYVSGQSYYSCIKCPIESPFLVNNRCLGCSSYQFINFIKGECSTQEQIKQMVGNKDSSNILFFPPNYCPPGQYIESPSQCNSCPSIRPNPSPNLKFCCKNEELFNLVTNSCDQSVCQGKGFQVYKSSDGKSCVEKCEKDEIIIDVSTIISTQKVEFQQCKKCTNPTPILFNGQCMSKCPKDYSFSEVQNECIRSYSCEAYFFPSNSQEICLGSSYFCPVFDFDLNIPSGLWRKINRSDQCVICPIDKPFVDVVYGQFACSRCLDKIRDYDSGRCVSSIDQISNPGTGTFFFNRQEYWPKRINKLCNANITSFAYNDLGLKECIPSKVDQTSCNPKTEVFDEKTKTCIKPEMCSLNLSSDRKTCSLSSCKIDEITVSISLNQTSLQGYYFQCQLCPKNRPFKQPNGDCNTMCVNNQIQNINGTLCIEKTQCALLSSDWSRCVSQCEQKQIVIKDKNFNYCSRCPNSQPFFYNQNCYSECPMQENLVASLQENTCIPSKQCTVVSKSGKYCLDACPPNLFLDYTSDQKKCVQSCQKDNVLDTDTYECVLMQFCKKYVSSSSDQCIEQCTPQQYIEYTSIFNNSFKRCVDNCPDRHFIDTQTRECKPWYSCKFNISNSGDQCIEICPLGEESWNYTNNVCTKCSKLPQRIYFDGQKCTDKCIYPNIVDEETKFCIQPLTCTKFISLDGKSCVSNCSVGVPVTSNSVTQCKCPTLTPFANRRDNPDQCIDKCIYLTVYDRQKDFKYCAENEYQCDNITKYNREGGIDCVDFCPDDYIRSQNSNQKQTCISCSSKDQVAFQSKCYQKCPQGHLLKPGQKSCFPSYECEDAVDIENQMCSKGCSGSQVIIQKEQLCFPYYGTNTTSQFQFDLLSNSQLEAYIQISQYKSPNNVSMPLNQEMVSSKISYRLQENLYFILNESSNDKQRQLLLQKLFSTAIQFLGIFIENQNILQLIQSPSSQINSTQLSQHAFIVSQFSKDQFNLSQEWLDKLKRSINPYDLVAYSNDLKYICFNLRQLLLKPINSLEKILTNSTNLCYPKVSKVCIAIRSAPSDSSSIIKNNSFANNEQADSQSKIINIDDTVINKSQIKNGNEQDDNSILIVAIISLCAFSFLLFMIFGIYLILKRYNHKNNINKNVILQIKKNSNNEEIIVPQQSAISSINDLNQIDQHQSHITSTIKTANQL